MESVNILTFRLTPVRMSIYSSGKQSLNSQRCFIEAFTTMLEFQFVSDIHNDFYNIFITMFLPRRIPLMLEFGFESHNICIYSDVFTPFSAEVSVCVRYAFITMHFPSCRSVGLCQICFHSLCAGVWICARYAFIMICYLGARVCFRCAFIAMHSFPQCRSVSLCRRCIYSDAFIPSMHEECSFVSDVHW